VTATVVAIALGSLVMLVFAGLAISGQLSRIADAIEAQNKAYGISDDSNTTAAEIAASEKGTP